MFKTKKKHTNKIIFSIIILIFLLIFIFLFLQKKQKKEIQKPHVIISKKKEKPKKKKPHIKYYKIAVIIDDVGYPVSTFKYFLNFKGKLTFSVLPNLTKSKDYARKLHEHGFEIMIHIPMEPIRYPIINPGPGALLMKDSATTIYKKLNAMISENPWAVGANNHMGSRLTQDCTRMKIVLETLNQKHMFFIDSLTTSKSCAYREAIKLKVPSSKRDIFLDNKNDFSYIQNQFLKLINVAKAKGEAIGIGHIQNMRTIEVLNSMLKREEKFGFIFSYASDVIKSK